MASSVSATGNNVIHRAKGSEGVVPTANAAPTSSAIEEARRIAMANAVPANNTTTTDDSAVSFSDDQEDEEVDDEEDDEEEEDNAANHQAAFNAAAAAAAAAAFQRQLLANFPMFHEQKDASEVPNEGASNPFETYIAAAAAAAAAANAEALIRHQQQLVMNSGSGRTSRSEKRAAHDSGTDDTDLSQRSALQPNQKRRKQSKPVRISSEVPGEAHPALTAFLAAQSAAAAAALFQANQTDDYEKRQDEQEEGQLPASSHPSMARNLAEFLTSSGAMNPSGKSFYPAPSQRLIAAHDYPGMFHAAAPPEEGDNSRPSSHSSSPDSKKNMADDVAKYGGFLPATSTPGSAYGPGSHPFLFPFLTGTPVTASSNKNATGGGGGGGGMRIFNHEAYCELCNKEFCNKYFLKTHKANKHGIYVDGIQPGSSVGGASAASANPPVPSSSSAPPSSPAASQTVSTPASTPNPPFSVAGSAPYSGAPLSLTVGAMSYPMHPPNDSANSSEPVNYSPIMSTPPQSGASGGAGQKMATPMNPGLMDLFPLWSANNSALSNSNGQPTFLPMKQQHPGGIVNPEAYCELCQKEFCNKYFLKRHKAKMHGITPPEGPPAASSGGSKSKSKSQSSKSATPAASGGTVDLIKIPLTPVSAPSAAVTPPSAPGGVAAPGSESGSEHPNCEPADNSFSLLMMPTENSQQSKGEAQPPQNKDSLSLLKIPTPTLSGMFSTSPALVDRMPKTPNSLVQQQQGQLFSPERLRQMGVINTEAFCEICCKEFCNKYFLRTHKFKKHGIGSMPEPNSQPGESSSSSSNGAPNNNNKSSPPKEAEQKTPLNLTSSTPPAIPPENGMPLNCELCQRPFQSAYLLHMHKTYFHNQPSQEEPVQDDEDAPQTGDVPDDDDSSGSVVVKSEPKQSEQDEAENSGINISADLQKLQSMIMELNGANQSAQRWPEAPKNATSDAGSPQFINSSAGNGGGIVKIVQQHEQASELQAPGPQLAAPSTTCQLCGGKDFFTPYFLQIHMQNYHGIGSNETMDAAVAAAASQLGLDRLLQDLNQQSSPNANQLMGGNANKRPANRSSSSGSGASGAATRSYCQICNKELCNKYFMKTHMLKMHGIHLEASGGGAQIGGVQCDICHKELCSKYFLKVHKQNTHGIVYPDSEQPNSSKEGVMDLSFHQNQSSEAAPPTPASKTENCPFCPKRFKTAKSLRSHVSHDHPSGSGATSTCCYICNQPFADVVALQVHLIKSHANQLTEQATTPPPSSAASTESKTPGTFQCSFCDFSSTSLPYLFAHERTHHADQQQQGAKKEADQQQQQQQQQQQKVQCPLCAEPLPLEQFQTHLMAHQLPANFLHTLIPSAAAAAASIPPKAPTNSQDPIPVKRKKKLRNRRYRCSVCREKFATRQLCLTHILQLHPPIIRSSIGSGKGSLSPVSAASSLIQSPRPLCCPRCGFSTRLPHALRAHLRSQQCVPVVARNPELQQLPPYMAVPTSAGSANNNGLLQVQGQHAHRQDFVLQAFLLTQPDSGNKRRSKSSTTDETNGAHQHPHDDGGSSEDGKSTAEGDDERAESSPSKSANSHSVDEEEGQSCNFIPSLILLPVNRRIANPLSMTFSLTPA